MTCKCSFCTKFNERQREAAARKRAGAAGCEKADRFMTVAERLLGPDDIRRPTRSLRASLICARTIREHLAEDGIETEPMTMMSDRQVEKMGRREAERISSRW